MTIMLDRQGRELNIDEAALAGLEIADHPHREQVLTRHLVSTLIASVVPLRYRTADTTNQVALAWIAVPHDFLYVDGPVGSGKTHLVCALVRRHIAATLTRPVMTTITRLANSIKRSWDDRSAGDPLQVACTTSLLVLDDLGVERQTDWAAEQLMHIIDTRYNEQRPTIITSNVKPGKLGEHIGDRATDRIAQNVTHVALTGKSRRRG